MSYPVQQYRTNSSNTARGFQEGPQAPRSTSAARGSGSVHQMRTNPYTDAYRSGSKYKPGFKPPAPASPWKIPRGPASAPVFGRRVLVPTLHKTALAGLGTRALARFIPYVGLALTAYELYQWYMNQFWVPGFERCGMRDIQGCAGGGTVDNQRPFSFLGLSSLAACPSGTSCANPQVGPAPGAIPDTVNSFTAYTWFKWSVNGNEYSAEHHYYRRTSLLPGEAFAGMTWATNFPVPAPMRWPSIDPMSMPIMQPVPFPMPLPWGLVPLRSPNPERSPEEQTHRGPNPEIRPQQRPWTYPQTWPWTFPRVAPSPKTRPDPKVAPNPRTVPGPIPQPRPVPYIPLVTSPGLPNPTRPLPPVPRVVELSRPGRRGPRTRSDEPKWPRRPRAREKEKKLSITAGNVGRVYGMVTEIDDFTNALYYAIPHHVRCPGAPLGYSTDTGKEVRTGHQIEWGGLTKPVTTSYTSEKQHPRKQYQWTRVGSGPYSQKDKPVFEKNPLPDADGTYSYKLKSGGCDHRPPLNKKIDAVYKHWKRINWEKAAQNLLLNEVGDRIGGELGRAGKRANEKLGRPFGIQHGPLH